MSRFKQLVANIKEEVTQTDIDQVSTFLANGDAFLLIDVRSKEDFAAGHLPHAVSGDRGTLEIHIEKMAPDLNQKIVLYCGGGSRSALSAYFLQRMGYTNVFSMAGGFRAWKAANLAINT